MKKICLLFSVVLAFCACNRKNNTTNNYYTLPSTTPPAFIVDGIRNITMVNSQANMVSLQITVTYKDSAQQSVALSVSGLPAGIVIDTSWISHGIPTFNTMLTFYDTTFAGAVPGTYPLTMTATSASGQVKSYPFTLKILPMPTAFLGKYNNCTSPCVFGAFTDSLYADPSATGKVWFSNFASSGQAVYALIGSDGLFVIPSQVVGGISYDGVASGTVIFSQHRLNLDIHIGATSCTLSMN